jgi:hypothetical protein
MGSRGDLLRRSFAGLAALAVAGGAATAQAGPVPTPGKPGNPICLKPTEPGPEKYGPTDIGAVAANGRLSVAVNPQGTLSVFRWPSVSYFEQVRYNTVSRDLPRLGLDPTEGAFSGLALELRDGSRRTVWLRDLEVRQRYASEDSDTIVTRYRDRGLDLLVEIDDVVPARGDVLLRRHVLRLGARSSVRSARLIAYANFNPTASKRTLVPTEDWCEEVAGTDVARYDARADALVYEISELDQSTATMRSAGIAIGASRRTVGHHVGADTYTGHPSTRGGPQSAYDDAADGALAGNDRLGPAEVDAALAVPIGRSPVTVTFAAGEDGAAATHLLERFRARDAVREARAKRRDHLRWLARAALPAGAPRSHVRLAKRSLVALRQAIDERAGADGRKVAIVASLSTQSPYYLDWVRDGAFFNEVLHEIGHGALAERHNDFYVEVQHKLEEGAPPGTPLTTCFAPTPSGAWFMTNYADGLDAGLFPFEIDEAALGAWTLWRHYELERGKGRGTAARPYLERVYPAIARTGDLLVAFRDPRTGLPAPGACEDDNPPKAEQPTMHASGPVLLAMRSAEAAARELGRDGDAVRFAARRAELEQAIDEHYDTGDGAWTAGFGDGGWALWPIVVEPYDHPRSRAQAEAAWRGVAPAFQAPDGPRRKGQYEAKALHGLAHFHNAVDPGGMARVKRGLAWMADVLAAGQETGVIGESWTVRDGEVFSYVAQPHVWEHTLFYLAAIEAYGRAPYRAGRLDRLLRPAPRFRQPAR